MQWRNNVGEFLTDLCLPVPGLNRYYEKSMLMTGFELEGSLLILPTLDSFQFPVMVRVFYRNTL